MQMKKYHVPIGVAVRLGKSPTKPPSDTGPVSKPVSLVMYGRLYNWNAATAKALIDGFDLPTSAERQALRNYLNNAFGLTSSTSARLVKHCRQVDSPLGAPCATSDHPRWNSHTSVYGTNETLLSGLPAGWINADNSAQYFGTRLYLWNKDEAITSPSNATLFMFSNSSNNNNSSLTDKNRSVSIRLFRAATEDELLLPEYSIVGYASDFDGNIYRLVRISTNVWTVQNFAGSKYADGSDIPDLKAPNNNSSYIFFADEEASIWK